MDKAENVFTSNEITQLTSAVKNEMRINLISYSLVEKTEKQLDIILDEILKKYDMQSIRGSVYTCIKELAVNGTKANLKSVFFNSKKIPKDNETNYKRVTELFKRVLEKSKEKNFGKVVYDKGYYVKIGFDFSNKGLLISVYNNCNILKKDKERIKSKLEKSKTYESIADYYMDAFDDTEGAGMGLAMIIIILKGMNIDVDNFHISTYENKGMEAKIFFPFDVIDTSSDIPNQAMV